MQAKPKPVQIIKNRLYWLSDKQPPKNISKSFYFNIDNDLVYDAFNQDFGPLNLGKTWKYVTQLDKLLLSPQFKTNQIYHFTSIDPEKAVNAAYLMCAFTIIVLGTRAKDAAEMFKDYNFKPFRDAGYGQCTYKCTLLDCLNGLQYAIKLGWFKYKTFNLAQYQHYEKMENGDLNWIVPQKFIAFSSPFGTQIDKFGNRTLTPHDFVPIFKKMGVSMVIRLNNKIYQSQHFVQNNIKHLQLFFADGSVPSSQIVNKFLYQVQKQPGAIAVHCKAGLGRTGTLIALYCLKHYQFPAAAFIGWIRIVRPGSILGPQQNYLIQMQSAMRMQSQNSPIWKQIKDYIGQYEVQQGIKNININSMNEKQKYIMYNGEAGQGQNLVQAKNKKQSSSKNPSAQKSSYYSPKVSLS